MSQPHPLPASAAADLINWIKKQDFYTDNQQPNYAVGLTDNGNVIISPVGGVTERKEGMVDLQAKIQKFQWFSDHAPNVYLAQKFGGDGNSNHGEMCVLAAADSLGENLVYILCTGDNCPACYATLASAGVTTGNAEAGGTQSGWVHPRGTMALGTQLGHPWKSQISELKAYNKLSDKEKKTFAHQYTQKTSFAPQGRCTLLI